MSVVTRFAPSPTGELHLGSAYSAWVAWKRAREAGGTFLVRIEDIDIRRCKREFETAILADLAWLRLVPDGAVRRQSDHFAEYGQVLDWLDARRLVYPCFCTRSDIAASCGRAARSGWTSTIQGRVVLSHRWNGAIVLRRAWSIAFGSMRRRRRGRPGRTASPTRRRGRIDGEPLLFGDVVIARKDTPTSYHLSVTYDDHLQGITLVTRGEDLLPSTHVHVLLQKLLGYATPLYAHHRLLTTPDGRRFAKRDKSLTLRALRESGRTPEEVFTLLPKD